MAEKGQAVFLALLDMVRSELSSKICKYEVKYGVLTVSKNKNIIIVKIILVQPICTHKLLANSSLE